MAFIIASEARFGPEGHPLKELEDKAQGIVNFIAALRTETQMIVSALGKYALDQLSKEDLGALDKDLADMFGIEYIYKKKPSEPLDKSTNTHVLLLFHIEEDCRRHKGTEGELVSGLARLPRNGAGV